MSSLTTSSMTSSLRAPYAIYFGDVQHDGYAKTGLGLIHWRRNLCCCEVRLPACAIEGGLPVKTVEEAAKAGAGSLVLGVAPAGGGIPANWIADLVSAAEAGMDIVSGMHVKLASFPELRSAAQKSGVRLVNVRTPPDNIPIGTGEKRLGNRLLTVGTDCAVGKKYTALAIEQELRSRGVPADFRATGQTGVMIAGAGIPIDAVIADFISGAAEMISPAASPTHWDVIEGQGAMTNPSYAGVSLGLLHGSQPDALVLCHDPSRTHHIGAASALPLVNLTEAMDLHLSLARRVNSNVRFVGVSVNTSKLNFDERPHSKALFADETGLPVVDPLIDGVSPIVDKLLGE